MPQLPKPIDWQELLKLTNNKPALAKELLGMLAAELPLLSKAINDAYQRNDLIEMKDNVHKLHGSCCYTGVQHLKNITQKLEESIRVCDNHNIKKTLVQLNLEIQRVMSSFNDQSYDHE